MQVATNPHDALSALISAHDALSVIISAFALLLSFGSAVLSFRADRRAQESVRPYISTGVHAVPDDMCVSLSNYGVGLAVIKRVSMSRGEAPPQISLASLLGGSANYQVKGVSFVQDEYHLRPGGMLCLAKAETREGENAYEALRDWTEALKGIRIAVDYTDILGRTFRYDRSIPA